MTRPLQAEDLYAIKLVEDPQISPDGERTAYVLAEIDRSSYECHRSIWLAPTAGDTPTRYTSGTNDTSPRWSPDGRSLGFLRKPAGDVKPKTEEERDRGVGQPQLWVLPADGGEARQLTWARYGVGEPSWAPDGASIVYTAEVGEPDDPEAEDGRLKEKSIPALRTIDRLWYRLDGRGWNYERRSLTDHVRGPHPHAAADPSQRPGPAMPDRGRRADVHRAQVSPTRGEDGALRRPIARPVAKRSSALPGDPPAPYHRLVCLPYPGG